MKERNQEELMKIICALDPNAHIRHSGSTDKFYISSNIEFKNEDDRFTIPVHHCNTIYEAIVSFYKRIQGRTLYVHGLDKRVPILFNDNKTYKDALTDRLFSMGLNEETVGILTTRIITNSQNSIGIFKDIKGMWESQIPKESNIFDTSDMDILNDAIYNHISFVLDKNISTQEKPEVITICSSTRFKKEIDFVTEILELQNKIVFPVVCISNPETLTYNQLDILNIVHRNKIDMSTSIFVIDVNGYIGDSVKSEIDYAKSKGKKIYYLSNTINNAFSILK